MGIFIFTLICDHSGEKKVRKSMLLSSSDIHFSERFDILILIYNLGHNILELHNVLIQT